MGGQIISYHLLNTNNPLGTTLALGDFRADLSHSVSEKNVDSFIAEELSKMKDGLSQEKTCLGPHPTTGWLCDFWEDTSCRQSLGFSLSEMSDWVASNISPNSYTCIDFLGRYLL